MYLSKIGIWSVNDEEFPIRIECLKQREIGVDWCELIQRLESAPPDLARSEVCEHDYYLPS